MADLPLELDADAEEEYLDALSWYCERSLPAGIKFEHAFPASGPTDRRFSGALAGLFCPVSQAHAPTVSFQHCLSCRANPDICTGCGSWTATSGLLERQGVRPREMTYMHQAKILGVNQAAVSKLERRTEMHVSMLQDFVKAGGGTR